MARVCVLVAFTDLSDTEGLPHTQALGVAQNNQEVCASPGLREGLRGMPVGRARLSDRTRRGFFSDPLPRRSET